MNKLQTLLKVNPYIELLVRKGFTEDEANDFVFSLLEIGSDVVLDMMDANK